MATCHGAWSRNREFGEQVGSGRAVAELLDGRKMIGEGYKTTRSFHELCLERKIDAPVLREAHAILFEGKPLTAALNSLMMRGLKVELAEADGLKAAIWGVRMAGCAAPAVVQGA